MMRTYWVYIMASLSRVLYTGVTNDVGRRVNEHKQGLIAGFTRRYRITRLVYFEEHGDIRDAIAREKQIKGDLTTLTSSPLSLSSKRRRLVILRAEGPKDLLPQQILRYSRSFATRACRALRSA